MDYETYETYVRGKQETRESVGQKSKRRTNELRGNVRSIVISCLDEAQEIAHRTIVSGGNSGDEITSFDAIDLLDL